jgi:hypothetical protein
MKEFAQERLNELRAELESLDQFTPNSRIKREIITLMIREYELMVGFFSSISPM